MYSQLTRFLFPECIHLSAATKTLLEESLSKIWILIKLTHCMICVVRNHQSTQNVSKSCKPEYLAHLKELSLCVVDCLNIYLSKILCCSNKSTTKLRFWLKSAHNIQMLLSPLSTAHSSENRASYSLGPSPISVPEWGVWCLYHLGPAGHAYRQGVAQLAGVQRSWWNEGDRWECFYTIFMGLAHNALATPCQRW